MKNLRFFFFHSIFTQNNCYYCIKWPRARTHSRFCFDSISSVTKFVGRAVFSSVYLFMYICFVSFPQTEFIGSEIRTLTGPRVFRAQVTIYFSRVPWRKTNKPCRCSEHNANNKFRKHLRFSDRPQLMPGVINYNKWCGLWCGRGAVVGL